MLSRGMQPGGYRHERIGFPPVTIGPGECAAVEVTATVEGVTSGPEYAATGAYLVESFAIGCQVVAVGPCSGEHTYRNAVDAHTSSVSRAEHQAEQEARAASFGQALAMTFYARAGRPFHRPDPMDDTEAIRARVRELAGPAPRNPNTPVRVGDVIRVVARNTGDTPIVFQASLPLVTR